ncbi:MAG: RNA-directed DNA polymerase [Methylocystaceae bacterium]|nr:RNA-directed DNA polymerase [Methylocystaceae bacterium]
MSKRLKRVRITPKTRYQRPVITDVLPFEVPPSFSNGGFFYFLSKFNVRVTRRGEENWLSWDASGSIADPALSVIFNFDKHPARVDSEVRDGVSIAVRSRKLKSAKTMPFNFKISHKDTEFRRLSIPHPQNQVLVAGFYDRYGAMIIYGCERSSFSIRKPSNVAKTARFRDRLFKERSGGRSEGVELQGKEYEAIGSYFAYREYSNIFKFYENYSYLNAEKKYSRLLKLDISGCFDSIYTHSIAWAVIGHEATKENLDAIKKTFPEAFDSLMQQMNRGETNGILIGPEFSRIFAEIILQDVDSKLEAALFREHDLRNKVDYQIFRYVDDYFVFSNDPAVELLIKGHLATFLRDVKLRLSAEKSEVIERPIITPLTIAKNRISEIFSNRISVEELEKVDPDNSAATVKHFRLSVKSKPLIVDFKAAIRETGVRYKDVLNYALASIERRVGKFFLCHARNHFQYRNDRELMRAILELLEFSFFIYAAEPRVNFSVRLSRIISTVVDKLHELGFDRDAKDHIFKYIFDNLFQHIKHTPHDRFHEVETLYLLLAINKLGRAYTLPEEVLARFLGIDVGPDGSFKRSRRMSYFSISVCLLYIRNRRRFSGLKRFIECEILQKFRERTAYLKVDTELVVAFLDLQRCPYVSVPVKNKLAAMYGLSVHDIPFLSKVTPHWFTNWLNFDLSIELDKKRAREVY